MSAKKKLALFVLVDAVCIVLAVVLVLWFGNPQWHWRLYVFQAKGAENGILNAPDGYTGVWNNWGGGGRLLSTYNYVDGKRHGSYKVFGAEDIVSSEGQYANGELDGVQTIQQDNGVVTEVPYENGKRHGVEISRFPSGQVAIEAPWEEGISHGIVTYYYESGARQAALPFYQGKLEGSFNTWYEGGQRQSEEAYRGGELNGRSVFWAPDGKETMALNYRDGRMEGLQMWFHPNGVKSRETIIHDGVPDGHWREWDENGEPTVDDVYENGELKKKAEDDDAGTGS